MKMVLAISGGIDSMVLMHLFRSTPQNVVVAHFDHGMRPSSKDDAEFVRKWARKFGMKFCLGEGHLPPETSEADARAARYKFLKEVARKVHGDIMTAHHVNDLAETVAINIMRGTGWRGLTPFSDHEIFRPFIDGTQPISKYDVYLLGLENNVVWRQDPTNAEPKYLRNRIRKTLFDDLNGPKMYRLLNLYEAQKSVREEIEEEVEKLLPKDRRYQRSWFKKLDDAVALEILRGGLIAAGVSATRPQILDFLNAVRTYEPGKKFNLPGGKMVTLRKDDFVL